MNVINFGLMKHPMNWVIVTLMVVIAGIAGHLALSYFGVSPKTDGGKKSLPSQITPASSPAVLDYKGGYEPGPISSPSGSFDGGMGVLNQDR